MATASKSLEFKGRPLRRKDNILYYGSMAEKYVIVMQILSTKDENDMTMAEKIQIQLMLTDPEVLLLDEPTRGIDVGAKYEIYQLILDLANKGKTVIMVSSEMPELLGVCDRIVVMSGGRVAGEVDARNTTQEEIMTLAAKYV